MHDSNTRAVRKSKWTGVDFMSSLSYILKDKKINIQQVMQSKTVPQIKKDMF